jgi:hypothetical protein
VHPSAPGAPQGEPDGGILQQLCDVLLRPERYEVLECDGELFIRRVEGQQRRAAVHVSRPSAA